MGNSAVGRAAAIVPLLVVALMIGDSLGHDIRMSARVEGRRIVGKVFVRGGGAVAGATVTALDPDRRELARTQTDREGLFSLPIRVRCDHRLLADIGDGHGAEYVIKASLLPEELAAEDDTPGAPAPQPRQPPPAEDASTGAPADTQIQSPAKTAIVDDAVKQLQTEIDELRHQLDQYRQRVRLLDVLGGIGYILGLTGIAHYWLSLRRNR